jgi:hypothetical protein
MGMSTVKETITIWLPEEQIVAARRAVADGSAVSVSAYISQALARRDADEEFFEDIAESYEEAGEPTNEDHAWARGGLELEL